MSNDKEYPVIIRAEVTDIEEFFRNTDKVISIFISPFDLCYNAIEPEYIRTAVKRGVSIKMSLPSGMPVDKMKAYEDAGAEVQVYPAESATKELEGSSYIVVDEKLGFRFDPDFSKS